MTFKTSANNSSFANSDSAVPVAGSSERQSSTGWQAQIDDLAAFISASPSSYHCAQEISRRLEDAGYTPLEDGQTWSKPQVLGRHFIVRDGAVIAWSTPAVIEDEPAAASGTFGYRIVGSHTDSPTFKLKPNPVATNYGWQQVAMEVYGGGLNNSWLDRDLGLAGRLVDLQGRQYLVKTPAIMRISQLAPHLDRSVNDELKLDRQQHLMPILGCENENFDLYAYLCELAGLEVSQLAGHEVFAYPTELPSQLGVRREFFASWRLDNLSSVHASLTAFLSENTRERVASGKDVAVFVAFDHEEVGSATKSGAAGPLLESILHRLSGVLAPGVDSWTVLARSSCISADAGHAIHPNYPEKHDPNNRPHLNEGPLLKLNANQRYATDAVGEALWNRACQAAGVPSQSFVSNNSVPCGSTIGPITATRLGITTVDVGVPLLSMHSARELAGCADQYYLAGALAAYWAQL